MACVCVLKGVTEAVKARSPWTLSVSLLEEIAPLEQFDGMLGQEVECFYNDPLSFVSGLV
jgi:hypothetical protein